MGLNNGCKDSAAPSGRDGVTGEKRSYHWGKFRVNLRSRRGSFFCWLWVGGEPMKLPSHDIFTILVDQLDSPCMQVYLVWHSPPGLFTLGRASQSIASSRIMTEHVLVALWSRKSHKLWPYKQDIKSRNHLQPCSTNLVLIGSWY